ncbi:MAG: hypothetical protein HY243_10565 [Proteobacteria bacterium]|nr:hypothetical protein [Pseudomonadota bacterium]
MNWRFIVSFLVWVPAATAVIALLSAAVSGFELGDWPRAYHFMSDSGWAIVVALLAALLRHYIPRQNSN